LVILSRWPIVESNMVRYPLNGRPAAFYRGDWFVGKGVACARIQMGPSKRDIAEVFCTHVCPSLVYRVHVLTPVAPRPL
jgi:sphingomyelin phosphodiesterase 2